MTDSTPTPDHIETGPAAPTNLPAAHPSPGYAQPVYPLQYSAPMYAQPLYVAAPPQPRGKSIASMVLGIVAVFFGYTLIVPIVGLILGITGIKTEPAGRGMATTGLVLNGIMLAGWGIVVVLFFLFVVVGIGAASTAGTTGTY